MRQLVLWSFLIFSSCLIQAQVRVESVYTELASAKCKTIKLERESGSSVQRCPGVAGYRLLIDDDDSRQSITVVTPGGKEFPLDFWNVITRSFSSVGSKAEWRVQRKNGKPYPIALIVRVNASQDPEHPDRVTSYLAVAKISRDKVCVTHKLLPGAKSNEEARRAADEAQANVCLKDSIQQQNR